MLRPFVGSYRDDLAIGLGHDDTAVEGPFSWVVPPGDETVDDLDDLVQPRCP